MRLRDCLTWEARHETTQQQQVNVIVDSRLRKYDKLNFQESFAMFMGKAQLVEFGLKKLLITKYELKEKAIENRQIERAEPNDARHQ